MSERIKYNKLVRDKIGDHLAHNAEDVVGFEIRACRDTAEYKQRLYDKLEEEVQEFLNDPCAEEAADVLEVLYAVLKLHNIPSFEVDDARFHKAAEKGRFEDELVLEWVERNE